MTEVKDSGKREKFKTGAVRDIRDGKGRFDLLPPFVLERLAKHYEAGAKKYADRNWESGIPLSRCLDSAFRHLVQFMQGKDDEDHLIAAIWNLFAIAEFEERIKLGLISPELDDLPRYLRRIKDEKKKES